MKKSNSKKYLKLVLYIMIFFTVTMIVAVELNSIGLIKEPNLDITWVAFLVIMFIVSVLLIRIINDSYDTIFKRRNVDRFNMIGYAFIVMAVINYLAALVTPGSNGTIITIIPGVFITADMCMSLIPGLLSFVIAESFRDAIYIKEENDLTI